MSRCPISAHLPLLLLIALATPSHGMCAPRSNSDQADQSVKAEGIIDRVIVTGSEPVFRAGGYTFRVTPATEMHFGRGLQSLTEVETNIWATFEGKLDGSGAIVATKAAFARLKLPKSKPDPNAVQVTAFPAYSKVDGDKGFAVGSRAFPQEDHGGWCGWYDVTRNPAEQEHIRRLGMKLVPQYQRDLPADDRAKIPFRFYVMEETGIRSAIFCSNGLIFMPVEVVNRLKNEDQLAAVLADGIAGELQLQAVNARGFTLKEAVVLAAGSALGAAGPIPAALGSASNLVVLHKAASTPERERGRLALALISDAGFDPHQAPEAWRLLAPAHLPKDPAKLKTPERSQHLQDILATQYKDAQSKAVLGDTTPGADHAAAATPGSCKGVPH